MAEYPQREYIVRETEYPLGYTKEEEVCELVRCKDCKRYTAEQKNNDFAFGWCTYIKNLVPSHGFCAWGERKDGDHE